MALTLGSTAWSDDVVLVSYGPASRAIRDRAGNKARAFQRPAVSLSPTGYAPRLAEPDFARDQSAVAEPWVGEWGPRSDTFFLPAKDTLRGLIVPVDFPDVPATDPASAYRDILEPPAEAWFREVSYGRTELDLTTLDQWQRMSRPVAEYGLQQCCPSQKIKDFMQEAIALIDPDVDLSVIDAVFMVGPRESGSELNILLFRPWPGGGIMADGKELRFGVVGNGNYRPGEEHLLSHHLITHEAGHLLGLPDLYGRPCPTCGGDWDWAGAWDIMSDDRPSAHFFAWHKWLLGWLDPQQMRGLTDRGQLEAILSPIETAGGTKAIVIPLSQFRAYVIEVRRLIGEDAQLCDEGVLVWLVDSSLRNASGNAQVMTDNSGSDPASLEKCGVKYDAPFDVGPGEDSTFNDAGRGLTVEVLREEGDGSYLVRATLA